MTDIKGRFFCWCACRFKYPAVMRGCKRQRSLTRPFLYPLFLHTGTLESTWLLSGEGREHPGQLACPWQRTQPHTFKSTIYNHRLIYQPSSGRSWFGPERDWTGELNLHLSPNLPRKSSPPPQGNTLNPLLRVSSFPFPGAINHFLRFVISTNW